MLGDLGRVPLAAVLAREDAPGVDPGAAPGQPLGDLSLVPGVEYGEGELVQRDDPSAGDVFVGPHPGLGTLAGLQLHERRVVDGDHLLLLDGAVEGGAQGGPDALFAGRADDAPALDRGPLLGIAGGAGGADELVVG